MTFLTLSRRRWLTTLATASASLLLAQAAHAAQPVVEIIAFVHPPMQYAA